MTNFPFENKNEVSHIKLRSSATHIKERSDPH